MLSAMKFTIIGTLALGFSVAIGGATFKALEIAGGNSLLISGVFLTLIGSALLVIDIFGKPEA
jgi:hypothetical protein